MQVVFSSTGMDISRGFGTLECCLDGTVAAKVGQANTKNVHTNYNQKRETPILIGSAVFSVQEKYEMKM